MKPPKTNDNVSTEAESNEILEPEPEQPGIDKPGRALVVTNQLVPSPEERVPDGLISRILIRLGLRSSGTLRDELEDALSNRSNGDSEAFSPEERAMINNILRLREVRVEDVMVPRADIMAVDINTALDDLLLLFEESGHSRLPVFSDTMDDPRGMILAKDLQGYIVRTAGRSPRKLTTGKSPAKLVLSKINLTRKLSGLKLVRKVLFVPPSMLVTDLLARMQTARTQMALVIDEYGGTDGLVSLEDIIEEVFGEIEDEHDDEEGLMIEKSGDSIFTADARTDLDDVVALIGPGFQIGDLGEDVETIGGLVFSLAGRIPVRGEVIHGLPGFEFRILDADPRRIKRLQIVQRRAPARAQRSRSQESDAGQEQNN